MTHDTVTAGQRRTDGAARALGLALFALGPVSALARQGTLVVLIAAFAAVAVCAGPRVLARAAAAAPACRLGAILLLWITASLLWGSVDHALMLARVAATLAGAGLFALGASLLTPDAADKAARLALAGGLVLALFLVEEGLSGARVLSWLRPAEAGDPGTIFNLASRGTAILAVTVFSLAALLYARLGVLAAAGLVLTALTGCWLLTTSAATLAIALGAAVLVPAYLWPRFTATAVVGVLIFGMLFAPMIPDRLAAAAWRHVPEGALGVSVQQRLDIWQHTAQLITAQPLQGYGFNASRDYAGLNEIIPGTDLMAMPLHPHNGALQVWFELGLVGAALVCALLLTAWWGLRGLRERPLHAATALATLTAAGTIFMLSFSIWQFWWIAALGLAGGVLALALKAVPSRLGA